MPELRTWSDKVEGELATSIVAGALIFKSQWFEITPLPGNIFEVTVKEENTALLKNLTGWEKRKHGS